MIIKLENLINDIANLVSVCEMLMCKESNKDNMMHIISTYENAKKELGQNPLPSHHDLAFGQ